MIPGEYPEAIEIYQGDNFLIPLITLPNMTGWEGPADLTGATVKAQIRAKESAADPLAEFAVEVVDTALRQVTLRLTAEQTAPITAKKGVWDLQVQKDDWVGTLIKGDVVFLKEVTR